MKNLNITKDYITITGDPFADVGGFVIKYFYEKRPEWNIIDMIEYITKIYVKKWDGKLHAFVLNSTVTQAAFKGERKIVETLKYFNSLINETAPFEFGFCRITGRETKLFKAGRDNSQMSGSGTFVNFHHSFQLGIMLSKEVIIRMFFVPFGSISVGDKVAIIQSNSEMVNEYFVRKNCDANVANIGTSSSEGVLKSELGIPANALFRFVDDLFSEVMSIQKDDTDNLSLSLYHFTNFGASPDIIIYKLPSNVFRFYKVCQYINLKKDWQPFLFAHYTNSKFKGAKYNEETSNYELTRKGTLDTIDTNTYKAWYNIVLDSLLNNRPLIKLFLKWGRKHKFNILIVEQYQKLIRGMKPETLEKIKELAVFITSQDEDTIKKSIKALDGFKSSYELRRFFLKRIVVPNYKNGAEEPIITMEELVYYLFPDYNSWKEIRDLLLFAIYQELHAQNKTIEADLLDEDETIETEEN